MMRPENCSLRRFTYGDYDLLDRGWVSIMCKIPIKEKTKQQNKNQEEEQKVKTTKTQTCSNTDYNQDYNHGHLQFLEN